MSVFGHDGIPERECEVIGLMLQNPPSVSEFAERLPERAFTNNLTRAVWKGMLALVRAGTGVSIPALRETVKADPSQSGVPVPIASFLANCKQRAGRDAMPLRDLVDLMVDLAMKADVSAALVDIQKMTGDDRRSGEEIALAATKLLQSIASGHKPREAMTLHEAAMEFLDQVEDSYKSGSGLGMDWGLREIDRIMGAIQPGDFGVLGGPSGQGKTALAMQIGGHIARRLPVLMIQAEMRHADVAGREVMGMSGVSSESVESGRLTPGDIEAIFIAAHKLRDVPMEITYSDDMRVSRIRTRIQSFLNRYGKCGLVIIDTIKHVDPEDKGARTLVEKIMSSAKLIDKMAKSLGVPIMALAQVKQTYWERPGLQFQKNDLYGGGDLCEAASWAILVHQPAVRAAMNGGRDAAAIIDEWEGFAQIIAGKRRRGPGYGKGKLPWVAERTRFSDPGDDVSETFL
jgi:replicative DNA helicase